MAVSFSLAGSSKYLRSFSTHRHHNPQFIPSKSNRFNIHPTNKPTTNSHRTVRRLFTGFVEELGIIKQLGAAQDGGFNMKIGAHTVLDGVNLRDSIAVNVTCLTVTHFDPNVSDFIVVLSPETQRKIPLMEQEPGSWVNLEGAVKPMTRMGGHFVQGHVDGTGEVVSMDPEQDSL